MLLTQILQEYLGALLDIVKAEGAMVTHDLQLPEVLEAELLMLAFDTQPREDEFLQVED